MALSTAAAAAQSLGNRAASPSVHMADDSATRCDPLDEIIVRVRSGDPNAFEALFEVTIRPLRARALAITRNDFDADDVIAAVYERAWRRGAEYDPTRGSVRAWLMMMCRSQATDLWRQRRTRRALGSRVGIEECHPHVPLIEVLIDRRQHLVAVPRALVLLSPVRRQLIEWAFFRELSHASLARKLGVPLGTVKSHLRRALLSLRHNLAGSARDRTQGHRAFTVEHEPSARVEI